MIGILVIGDEIVTGRIQDANGAYLAKKLGEYGLPLTQITMIGDSQIQRGLKGLLEVVDTVFTTGGLGPTHDDLTEEKIGEFFALCENHLEPVKKEYIPNKIGTAPGLLFKKGSKRVFSLPGVPVEMRAMADFILEKFFVKERERERQFSVGLNYCHTKENDLAELLANIEKEHPEYTIGIYPGLSVLQVIIKGKGKTAEQFSEKVRPIVSVLEKKSPTTIFPWKEGKIALALDEELKTRGERLFFAESCTGGELAARMTKIPGASNYFLGSIVAYNNKTKEKLLGVKKETLSHFGAVSRNVVEEMTEGIFSSSEATWAISVSGIMGPSGGSEEKPIGTIWASIAKRGEKPDVGLIPPISTLPRKEMIERTTNWLLGALWRKLVHNVRLFS